MSESRERAANCWEVERHSCGEVLRPYCVIILRSKKQAGKSVVKASSSDFESMNRYAEQMNEDLYALTDEEFSAKYQLGHSA